MIELNEQEENDSVDIVHQNDGDILGNIHSFFSQALTNVQNTANSGVETLAWTASTLSSVITEGTTSNFNFLIDKLSSLVSGKEISEEQRRTALEIIKAGKDKGVDELEIEVDQAVGMKLISDNEIFKSNAVIGSTGKMTIKIKYK
ncbi:hypothetical protein [Synechocystis sp. PCC 7338]|uniref:hypothetical protein n=1 Tax=Synechocystis sp. PCC 7338 TaxID=2732530 RepID=UPI001BAF1EEC|nr:hypothetical protein [Synechocystis sp. PCC 7338]QUS61320.1 hypothetical protein HTZ78_12060 [Synechocystis sp. PCC 7338]